MKEHLGALAGEFKSTQLPCVFGMKIVIWIALIAWGLQAAMSTNWLWSTVGSVVLGLMFAHGVELQHQALHNSGFRSRHLNECAGIILGMPMLVSFAAYQASHLRHHRYLGTDKNREYFDYGDQYGQGIMSAALHVFLRFSMLQHYLIFLGSMVRAITWRSYPGETQRTCLRMRRDYLLMLAAIVLLGISSYATTQPLLFQVWLVPLVAVAAPVHAVIELPEHFRCETHFTDVFRNTRSITSGAFMTWFTNGNNFHVEHHLLPNLPVERLAEVHERIRPRIKYFSPTYFAFFLEILESKFSRPADSRT